MLRLQGGGPRRDDAARATNAASRSSGAALPPGRCKRFAAGTNASLLLCFEWSGLSGAGFHFILAVPAQG
jgi:hypothetical protein